MMRPENNASPKRKTVEKIQQTLPKKRKITSDPKKALNAMRWLQFLAIQSEIATPYSEKDLNEIEISAQAIVTSIQRHRWRMEKKREASGTEMEIDLDFFDAPARIGRLETQTFAMEETLRKVAYGQTLQTRRDGEQAQAFKTMAEEYKALRKCVIQNAADSICSICCDHKKDTMMQCGHFYCRVCLDSIRAESGWNAYSCPECRELSVREDLKKAYIT